MNVRRGRHHAPVKGNHNAGKKETNRRFPSFSEECRDVIVNLRLFALAKERAGTPFLALELPDCATVAHLKEALGEACPALQGLLPHLMIAVNSEYAGDDQPIPPGAEVAAIPPVSGGTRSK